MNLGLKLKNKAYPYPCKLTLMLSYVRNKGDNTIRGVIIQKRKKYIRGVFSLN